MSVTPVTEQSLDQPEFVPTTELEHRLQAILDEHNTLVKQIEEAQRQHAEQVNQAVARRHELLGQAQLLTEFISKEKDEAENQEKAPDLISDGTEPRKLNSSDS